jgi:hypothetical protein
MFSKKEKPSELGGTTPPEYEGDYQNDAQVVCPAHTTERRLVHKIDLHVIPFLCIMYLLAFLDR